MTTQRPARGHLTAVRSIRRALVRIAKTGDQVDFRRYLTSGEFYEAWRTVPLGKHLEIFKAVAATQEQVEARNPLPPPSNRQAYWDAERITTLKASWQRHGGELIRVARDMGITPGAARLAYKTYVVDGAVPVPSEKTRRKTQDGRLASGTHGTAGSQEARLSPDQAA